MIIIYLGTTSGSKKKGQKQPPEVFCKASCFWKFGKFHSKIPALESLFNKVVGLQACNFIEQRFQHNRCFPLKFSKFLGRHVLKNVCKQLLLKGDPFYSQNLIKNNWKKIMTLPKSYKIFLVLLVGNVLWIPVFPCVMSNKRVSNKEAVFSWLTWLRLDT